MTTATELPHAFVAKMIAKPGHEDALRALLEGAVELANAEAGTAVWFAVRTGPATFWIFDAFATDAARTAHAEGRIVEALSANASLLAEAPEILPADVLAAKLP